MKNFFKHLLNKKILLLTIIILVGSLVRFYNFPERIIFWSEQARSLMVSAGYLIKPSLLGQEYFRQDSYGHTIYSGAWFNYLLLPLILVSNYNPVIITAFFAILNIFTGVITYVIARKLFGFEVGFLSLILFMFNGSMVNHSLFIWNYNLLPLVGVIAAYLLWINFKKPLSKYVFLLGLTSGFGISLQVLFGVLIVPILFVSLWNSDKKLKHFCYFFAGVVTGNLPMVLFDLRHHFYETQTLVRYLLDTIRGRSDATFSTYYLLPLWPILLVLGAYVTCRIWQKSKLAAAIIVSIYIYLNITSQSVNFKASTGMPSGLNVYDIDRASQIIAEDAQRDFNVTEVLDFDKRAYIFRYFLQYKYNKIPLAETEYQNLQSLYALSKTDYNFDKSNIWEVNASGLRTITKMADIGSGYAVYKLTK
jgi:hypothetical protein